MRQPAGTPFVAEVRQTFDAVFLIVLVPCPDRVVVENSTLAVASQVMPSSRSKPRWPDVPDGAPPTVPGQLDQVLTRFRIEEAAADHAND